MTSQSLDPDYGRRGKLFGAWLFLLATLCCLWLGWHWPAIQHGTFAAGLAQGRIVRVTPSPERRFDRFDVLVGYKDGEGTPQRALDQFANGRFQVGEKTWVVYIDGSPDRAYMDPSMPMMIALAMAPGLLGLPLEIWLLVHTHRRYAQRRRALTEWTRMDVHDPRIQLRSMNLGARFGGELRTWRLQARVLDQSAHWRDIHSDWAGSARAPDLVACNILKVFIDPRHSRHYWLPLPIAG